MKWMTELSLSEELDQPLHFTRKCKVDIPMKYQNYQILHRSLITNRKLYIFRLIDSEQCDKCNKVETIANLLNDCPCIPKIEIELVRWIINNLNEKYVQDKKSTLLGNPETKFYIT